MSIIKSTKITTISSISSTSTLFSRYCFSSFKPKKYSTSDNKNKPDNLTNTFLQISPLLGVLSFGVMMGSHFTGKKHRHKK